VLKYSLSFLKEKHPGVFCAGGMEGKGIFMLLMLTDIHDKFVFSPTGQAFTVEIFLCQHLKKPCVGLRGGRKKRESGRAVFLKPGSSCQHACRYVTKRHFFV
jgi:hypothetical protein